MGLGNGVGEAGWGESAGVGVTVGLAEGDKCGRCWRVLPEVGHLAGHADLCRRCADAVATHANAAAD